jgi:hypothetical protein
LQEKGARFGLEITTRSMAHEATMEFYMVDDTKGFREMLFGVGKESVSIKEHTKEFVNIFKKFF